MTSQETRQAAIEALTTWQQGNQQAALDRIRPLAEQHDRLALGLISWFLHQMGEPHWRDGVPYAMEAARAGLPWVLNYYLGNMLNDPNLRGQAAELMQLAVNGGLAVDPIGNAMTPLQQGDHATAIALLEVAVVPPNQQAWAEFMEAARSDADSLAHTAGQVQEERTRALEMIADHEQQVASAKDRVTTQSNQLMTLIEQTTNAEAQSLFDKEAEKNEQQATNLWWGGFIVLVLAACLAVTPLFLHYREVDGHHLQGAALTTSHIAPTLALGAVSGILLSRARGRDRAAQRARDLSVALGTMFVYSGQIADESERQRFLHDMGRVVIESFLRQETPVGDDSGTPLAGLLSRLR